MRWIWGGGGEVWFREIEGKLRGGSIAKVKERVFYKVRVVNFKCYRNF